MSQKERDLIYEMATIIRYLDEDAAYTKYWLNEDDNGGYVPALEQLNN